MTLEFKMPKLGESVTEGTIGRWLKQPGETLAQYEPMLEVTTDKVDTEVSAPIDGTLLEILVPEGETVAVGTVIARLGDGGNGSATVADVAATTSAAPATASAEMPARQAPISPVVARLAAEHGVNLAEVRGTGAGGRVSKKDIEAFIARRPAAGSQPAAVAEPPVELKRELQQSLESAPLASEPAPAPQECVDDEPIAEPIRSDFKPAPPAAPAPVAPPASRSPIPDPRSLVPTPGPDDEIVPISGMRRAIAEHMVRSKQTAPHVTTVMEADLSRITAHRTANKVPFERQGVKLTFTPYFVQAVVAALQAVPIVNASYRDDGIVMHNRINVGMAVAIPDGLIVPVLKDADELSLLGLSRAVNDLAERARLRKLQPDETQGGTFTITNHGVSGSLFAMPIINQPQSAILGIGAIQKRVVVVSEHGLDAIAIRPMCYLSLTFDHRLIDGATADEFLGTVKQTLEGYAS